MGIFISALIGGLWAVLGSFVGQILVSLGISYLTYTGIDASISFARDYLVGSILSSSSQTVAVASALKIGKVINIITSALVGRMVIGGMIGGKLRQMNFKA